MLNGEHPENGKDLLSNLSTTDILHKKSGNYEKNVEITYHYK